MLQRCLEASSNLFGPYSGWKGGCMAVARGSVITRTSPRASDRFFHHMYSPEDPNRPAYLMSMYYILEGPPTQVLVPYLDLRVVYMPR